MVDGYVLPEFDETYEAFREGFEWDLPDRYNIASAALANETDGVALRHVDPADGVYEISYGLIDSTSDAFASNLHERGVRRGDRIGVCFPQGPELLVSHLAAYKLGAVVVPLSVLLGRKTLEYTLAHAGARALLIDREVSNRFAEAGVSIDKVETVLRIDQGSDRCAREPLADFKPHLEGGVIDATAETRPDDPAIILYTSGTSGRPKGVLQGHRYLIGSMPGYHCYFELFDADEFSAQRVWTPSEWAWAGALFNVVFPTLAIGGTVVSQERRSGFEPGRAVNFVREHGVTRSFMPPTALSMIRDVTPEPPTGIPLQVIQCGGEGLADDLREWAENTFEVVVNEGFGQTEANALAGECRTLFEPKPGSLGRAYPGHDLQVLTDTGEPADPGELGELVVELPDPVVHLGYWPVDDIDGTNSEPDVFRTGDVIIVDNDGYLYHRGRKDDLIISSGYRISPLEVETTLKRHVKIRDAIVGTDTSADGRTRIKAYIVTEGPCDLDPGLERELKQLVGDIAGRHKIPDEIESIYDPPLTRSGKIDRTALFE